VRRSEPVKAVLLIEERVYPGKAQGTIGLRIQKRFNLEKYGCTRTEPEIGTIGLGMEAGGWRVRDGPGRDDRHLHAWSPDLQALNFSLHADYKGVIGAVQGSEVCQDFTTSALSPDRPELLRG
jgi:hypothetical protein